VADDRVQHSEQRKLLEKIRQFVVLADGVQDYVDCYWELEQVSVRLLRDPSIDSYSDVMPKLEMMVRGLGNVSGAFTDDLGHQPDDEEAVNKYLKELKSLHNKFLASTDLQTEGRDTALSQIMHKIHDTANLARIRAIEAYRDVNEATQQRLAILNQYFPEAESRPGAAAPITQSSKTMPVTGDATSQPDGSFQVSTQVYKGNTS
jgi:hypothetical protein